MLARRFGFALLTVALLPACTPERERYPGPQGCGADDHCGSPSGGVPGNTGSGGAGGAGGSGGAAPTTTDVDGSLGLLITSTFDQVEPFAGKATIFAPAAKGGQVSASVMGSGATFSLLGVETGNTWFFVQDDSGGAAQVLSTWSPFPLPSKQAITLPILDLATLTNIASALPSVQVLSSSAAQIVIKVRRDDKPLAGVKITSGAPSPTVIAYDIGPGVYSEDTVATAAGGAVILFNAPPSNGTRAITLTDSTAGNFVVEVPITVGAATFAIFDL